MSSSLLTSRRFLPLLLTQFLGAVNDNLFKNALVMLVAYRLAPSMGAGANLLIVLAGAVFIAPYFLLSAMAGQIADQVDRARVARITKAVEIGVVSVAALGFYLQSPYFLLLVLFCLGIQATFFGPVKYALLPQHLHEDELIAGNAYIEAGMFLGILLGTIAGGMLILAENGAFLVSGALIVIALAGYMASRHIPPAPVAEKGQALEWNILRATWRIVQHDRKNPRVFAAIVAISWFWLVGAVFVAQFPGYAKEVLHGDETIVTLLLVVFSVGIGLGSVGCNVLLKGAVKTTYVPYAALGLSLCAVDVFFASGALAQAANPLALISLWEWIAIPAHWRILIDLAGVAMCGGLFIVPLYAVMQHDSDPDFRARTIAANNVINALFMVISALLTAGLLAVGLAIPQLFLLVAVANAVVAVWLFRSRNL